jgi:hypothetical protein
MGFLPGGSVLQSDTQHTNNTPHSNTAHKITKTIKDTLHTMNCNRPITFSVDVSE